MFTILLSYSHIVHRCASNDITSQHDSTMITDNYNKCDSATISYTAPHDHVILECYGKDACKDLTFQCGNPGKCHLMCTYTDDEDNDPSCNSVDVTQGIKVTCMTPESCNSVKYTGGSDVTNFVGPPNNNAIDYTCPTGCNGCWDIKHLNCKDYDYDECTKKDDTDHIHYPCNDEDEGNGNGNDDDEGNGNGNDDDGNDDDGNDDDGNDDDDLSSSPSTPPPSASPTSPPPSASPTSPPPSTSPSPPPPSASPTPPPPSTSPSPPPPSASPTSPPPSASPSPPPFCYNKIMTDTKCALDNTRYFRLETNVFEECIQQCKNTNCTHMSFGYYINTNVCMGCGNVEDREYHDGFNFYEMNLENCIAPPPPPSPPPPCMEVVQTKTKCAQDHTRLFKLKTENMAECYSKCKETECTHMSTGSWNGIPMCMGCKNDQDVTVSGHFVLNKVNIEYCDIPSPPPPPAYTCDDMYITVVQDYKCGTPTPTDRYYRVLDVPNIEACRQLCVDHSEDCNFYSYASTGQYAGYCMGCTHPDQKVYEKDFLFLPIQNCDNTPFEPDGI